MAVLTLPPIALFLQHALGDRVQGNWPAIMYPAAVIALPGWMAGSGGPAAGARRGVGIGDNRVCLRTGTRRAISLPPRIDPTAFRLSGWSGLAAQVEAMRVWTGAAFVASEDYGEAAELAWLLPPDVPVIAIDPLGAI